MSLTLDIAQALNFLDALDPGGRHTLASEAPFGGWDKAQNGSRARPTRRGNVISSLLISSSAKSAAPTSTTLSTVPAPLEIRKGLAASAMWTTSSPYAP
jgi:hypothetical protein